MWTKKKVFNNTWLILVIIKQMRTFGDLALQFSIKSLKTELYFFFSSGSNVKSSYSKQKKKLRVGRIK